MSLAAFRNTFRNTRKTQRWALCSLTRYPTCAQVFTKWLGTESNRRHADFQSAALPTELPSPTSKTRNVMELWSDFKGWLLQCEHRHTRTDTPRTARQVVCPYHVLQLSRVFSEIARSRGTDPALGGDMATQFNARFSTRYTGKCLRSLVAATCLLTGLGSTVSAQFASFALVSTSTSLRGSKSSIAKMYTIARRHDIDFLRTAADVDSAIARGQLVALTGTVSYEVSAAVGFAYATPEARHFVETLAPHFFRNCNAPLVITSATRPETRQPRNASQLSVHPTGIAVDLRRPYPGACLTWLRDTLTTMEDNGLIEVTEERHPPHFHVAVLAEPGSAPIAGLIDRLAAGDSSSASPLFSTFNELEQAIAPALAFQPLFHAPLLPSELLVAMSGEEIIADTIAQAPIVIASVSTGDVEVTAADTTNEKTAEPKKAPRRADTYKVRPGDTLWDIAKKYDLSVGELQRANKLGKKSQIKPKMILKIPG